MVVVLPAPLGPSRPKSMPSGDLEGDAVDGTGGLVALAVDLDEVGDLDDGGRTGIRIGVRRVHGEPLIPPAGWWAILDSNQ